MDQQKAWDNEYMNSQGVPTSTRDTPSSAIKKLIEYFKLNDIKVGNKVIDLGCGTGRNSRYLAEQGFQITAVDFSQVAIDKLRRSIVGTELAEKIEFKQCSLASRLPFDDNSFDLAVDIVTTMTLTPEELLDYETELRRVLKSGAYYLTYVLSDKDGYLETKDPNADKITIPESGITDYYFSEDFLKRLYANWEIIDQELIEKQDMFYGEEYTRRIWWLLIKNTK